MNILKSALAGVMLLSLGASAAIPSGNVFATFVTDKGLRAKESERYVTVYVKSSVTTDTVYLQFGEGADIDTLPVTKANTLFNIKKTGLSGGGIPVRIWAPQTVWFLNINNADATSFTPGTCATSVREFRCENDSLNNMDFLPQMTALEYLVCSNNRRVRTVSLVTPALQRVQLNKMPALESVTIGECPALYEFKLDMPLISSIDFSGCPALKTLLVTNASNLAAVNAGPAQKLESMTISGSKVLKSISLKNMPVLTTAQLYENSALGGIEFESVPKLATLNLRADNFSDLTLQGVPSLRTLTLSANPFTHLDINLPDLTSVTLDQCDLDTVDLSALAVLKSAYLRNGTVKHIIFNDNALRTTTTTLQLMNNHLGISDLPPRPAKMNATLNYYAPQAQPLLPRNIEADSPLDLGRWATGHTLAGTVPSVIKWETIFEEELVEGTDYTVKDGVYTFRHEIEDSVRCFISNEAFPSFALMKDSKGNITDYRVISNYIKVDADTGGAQGVEAAESVCVWQSAPLVISATAPEGALLVAYTAAGVEAGRCRVAGSTGMKLPHKGLYIVTVAGRSFKVNVR